MPPEASLREGPGPVPKWNSGSDSLFIPAVKRGELIWDSPLRSVQPFDCVHFEGKNPKYNEQMQPVDSRALWERHIR